MLGGALFVCLRPMTRGQTAHLKKAWLDVFRQCGNISTACRRSGVSRSAIYLWQEHDDTFAGQFRQAEIEATEALEAAAHHRAVDGLRRLKFDKDGDAILDPETKEPYTELQYSDTLLIFLLKARAPEKYRERLDVHQTSDAPNGVKVDLW